MNSGQSLQYDTENTVHKIGEQREGIKENGFIKDIFINNQNETVEISAAY